MYFRQKGMIRYDPTQNGNSHGEIPARTPNPKKAAKAKKQVVEINEFDNEKPPELSKDTFYNVSENLVDTLKQDEQFSLLKSFGTERSNTGENFSFIFNDRSVPWRGFYSF